MGVAAAAAVVLPVLWALTALAAGSGPPASGVIPEVSLDLERCATLPRPEIVRLVGLELEARVLPPGKAGPHAVRVGVACGPPGLQLSVADPITGKVLARTVAFVARESDGTLAARMVALAIAELVFTSWLELPLAQAQGMVASADAPAPPELRRAAQERAMRHAAAAPPPVPPSTPPFERPPQERAPAGPLPPAPPPRITATPPPTPWDGSAGGDDRRDGWCVMAVGQAMGPFEGVGLGWGAGARVGWMAGAPLFRIALVPVRLGAELDLTGAWNDVPSALGTVRVSSFSAAPRASLKVYPGGGRRAWLDLGAGARLGGARLVGAPMDTGSTRGHSLAGTWGGAAGYAGIGIMLGPVVLAVGLEAGQVLRSVSGLVDGDQPISISGRWLSGSFALGWGR